MRKSGTVPATGRPHYATIPTYCSRHHHCTDTAAEGAGNFPPVVTSTNACEPSPGTISDTLQLTNNDHRLICPGTRRPQYHHITYYPSARSKYASSCVSTTSLNCTLSTHELRQPSSNIRKQVFLIHIEKAAPVVSPVASKFGCRTYLEPISVDHSELPPAFSPQVLSFSIAPRRQGVQGNRSENY